MDDLLTGFIDMVYQQGLNNMSLLTYWYRLNLKSASKQLLSSSAYLKMVHMRAPYQTQGRIRTRLSDPLTTRLT